MILTRKFLNYTKSYLNFKIMIINKLLCNNYNGTKFYFLLINFISKMKLFI